MSHPTHKAGHLDLYELMTEADIDEVFDDLLEIDPHVPNPPSRRSNGELARVLAILDNLQTGGNHP